MKTQKIRDTIFMKRTSQQLIIGLLHVLLKDRQLPRFRWELLIVREARSHRSTLSIISHFSRKVRVEYKILTLLTLHH